MPRLATTQPDRFQPPPGAAERPPFFAEALAALPLALGFLTPPPKQLRLPFRWSGWQRIRWFAHDFRTRNPVVTGVLIGVSLSYIAYPFAADLFLPFYTDVLKPGLAGALRALGLSYPSFEGDNAASPYTNLQNAQVFYRESKDREAELLNRLAALERRLEALGLPASATGKSTQRFPPAAEETLP